MKHTSLPWEVETHNHIDNEVWHTILKGAVDITHNTEQHEIACDKYSALSQEENEANAAFIVRAVNNFDRLVKNNHQLLDALIDLQADIGGGKKFCGHDFTCRCAWEKATEAIKQAEGE